MGHIRIKNEEKLHRQTKKGIHSAYPIASRLVKNTVRQWCARGVSVLWSLSL